MFLTEVVDVSVVIVVLKVGFSVDVPVVGEVEVSSVYVVVLNVGFSVFVVVVNVVVFKVGFPKFFFWG
jgi:hypothetical protein